MIATILMGIGIFLAMPYLLKFIKTILTVFYALYLLIFNSNIRNNAIKSFNMYLEQNTQSVNNKNIGEDTNDDYNYETYEFDEEAYEFVKQKALKYGNAISVQFDMFYRFDKDLTNIEDIQKIFAKKYIFDWLDEARTSTIDAVQQFISSCGIPESEYIGSRNKNLDKVDNYIKDIQNCIKDITYIDEELTAYFNIELIKYLQHRFEI